ncbi:MAG: UDP-N-acetylglucosamine--N-acetylmuramyl-(pentapeptide) pyrophosphoryl-undecaprenol N-acetylglucosamine transferase [Candidatus Nomurabacteria bacterium]
MKIVFTGAGGGHFYPLIAVAERISKEVVREKIIDAEMFFLSDRAYNDNLLLSKNIKFIKIPAGKVRLYFSLENFFDPIKTFFGFFIALFHLFRIYPDIIFTKGGYASLPVLFAAKVLFIPVFMHESDSVPGKSNLLAAKFSKRIAVSYASAIKYFNPQKTAYTGQPIMEEYLPTQEKLNNKYLNREGKKKTIFVLGGSQGSEIINNIILDSLPELLEKYNIIHQVGENNYNKVKIASEVLLKNNPNAGNYSFFALADLGKYYEIADIAITRAGSSLFEFSAWGIPTIIVPFTVSNGNHAVENAFTFERAGCSLVIEEVNLKKNLLLNNINFILDNQDKYKEMELNNLNNFKSGAAELIANEIIKIGLSHNY